MKYRYFLPEHGRAKRPEKHRILLYLYGGIYVPEPAGSGNCGGDSPQMSCRDGQ
nr:hypothetical protein [Stomatobaculum longum]